MARMITGPVVGHVTGTSARILFEVDAASTVTATAWRTGAAAAHEVCKVDAPAGRPTVAELTELEPGTEYTVTFDADDALRARFRTFDGTGRFNILAVSCSNILDDEVQPTGWRSLRERVRSRKFSLLLHGGDQVYGDGPARTFARARALAARSTSKATRAAVLELYRDLYRKSWTDSVVREVLATIPNLMIWDDHEVNDHFGDDEKYAVAGSPDRVVAECAWQVYHEYQRQLWDAQALERPIGGPEWFNRRWGELGILFVDVRGGRAFVPYDRTAQTPGITHPYLSPGQWQKIERVLGPNGPFEKLKVLLVVTPVPLVFVSSAWIDASSPIALPLDLRGHWSFRQNHWEQERMLGLIEIWRRRTGGKVALIAGDVHVGALFQVRFNGQPAFQELVTSPIHRKEEPGYRISIYESTTFGAPRAQLVAGPFTWRCDEIWRTRNYGIARIDMDAPSIKLELES